MDSYSLTEIEKDIQPEDFPPESVWHRLVKYCGPAALMILAEYREQVGERLPIRKKSGFTRKAEDRAFKRKVQKVKK